MPLLHLVIWDNQDPGVNYNTVMAAMRGVDKICSTRTASAATLMDVTEVTGIHQMTMETLILCRRG